MNIRRVHSKRPGGRSGGGSRWNFGTSEHPWKTLPAELQKCGFAFRGVSRSRSSTWNHPRNALRNAYCEPAYSSLVGSKEPAIVFLASMRARETDRARLSHNLGVAGDYATTLLDSLKRVQRVAQPVSIFCVQAKDEEKDYGARVHSFSVVTHRLSLAVRSSSGGRQPG
jgi:hypothetical protein